VVIISLRFGKKKLCLLELLHNQPRHVISVRIDTNRGDHDLYQQRTPSTLKTSSVLLFHWSLQGCSRRRKDHLKEETAAPLYWKQTPSLGSQSSSHDVPLPDPTLLKILLRIAAATATEIQLVFQCEHSVLSILLQGQFSRSLNNLQILTDHAHVLGLQQNSGRQLLIIAK
jgi:hypothetical protein